MNEIDVLLLSDIENCTVTKQNLSIKHKGSLDAIELCTESLESLVRLYGEHCSFDENHAKVEEWAHQLGFTGNDALEFLRSATLIGDSPTQDSSIDAQRSLIEATSVIARSHLGLRLRRDFMFGISDLLRLRISQAMGLLRVQSESAALLNLMAETPSLGAEWLKTVDDAFGKRFHQRKHSSIVDAIRSLGLYDDYERGSNMSLHSRASGTALGVLLGYKGRKERGRITLIYQEVDNPELLLFWVAVYMQFHMRVLKKAESLFPEIAAELDSVSCLADFFEAEESLRSSARNTQQRLGKEGFVELLSGG